MSYTDNQTLINRLEAIAFERGLFSDEVLRAEETIPAHRTERQRDILDADTNNAMGADAVKTELLARMVR